MARKPCKTDQERIREAVQETGSDDSRFIIEYLKKKHGTSRVPTRRQVTTILSQIEKGA